MLAKPAENHPSRCPRVTLPRHVHSRAWWALLLMMAISVGCTTPKVFSTAPRKRAKVTVKLEQQPLEGARVTFVPIKLRNSEGRLIPLAFGLTDAQGQCAMKSSDGGDLIDAVRYRVLVSKPQTKTGSGYEFVAGQLPPDVTMMFDRRSNDLPEIYHRYSQLEVDLSAEQQAIARIKLDLKAN